jgi:hypothetical protein
MKPKFSLEECLKRYLSESRAMLYLEIGSPPISESRKEWEAEIKIQNEDIACIEYWLARVQSGEAI